GRRSGWSSSPTPAYWWPAVQRRRVPPPRVPPPPHRPPTPKPSSPDEQTKTKGYPMTTTTAPATGAWANALDLPAAARCDGQHDGAVTLDAAGVVLVAGGADATGTAVRQTAFYNPDPTDARWHAAAALGKARRLHTMTRLADGTVLVAGGIG